ncbi:MAG TPA: AarF/UbiB family protein, partial [Desulfobacteria bacterium]|nr:AarF/UbiB family protein [Desulfobacteria bacterium]
MPRVLKLFSLLRGLIKNDFQTAAGLMGEMHGLPQKLGQHFTLYPGQQYQEYFDRLCAGGRQEDIPVGDILNSLGIDFDKADVYAQASIGQVYRVETNARELAVKIRYTGVEKRISTDFKVLKTLL